MSEEAECNLCHGSGKMRVDYDDKPVEYTECPRCNGTGFVPINITNITFIPKED